MPFGTKVGFHAVHCKFRHLTLPRPCVILKTMTAPKDSIAILDLYPGSSETDARLAEARWREYVAIVLAIHERIENDPQARKRFNALTDRKS